MGYDLIIETNVVFVILVVSLSLVAGMLLYHLGWCIGFEKCESIWLKHLPGDRKK